MARILLCDDSRTMLNLLERRLVEAGHQIVGKGQDGDQGVQLYRDLKPDLVLLDVTMPNKDGRECLVEIIQMDPSAHVVMLSAVLDTEVINECMKAGAKAFISKSNFNSPTVFAEKVLSVLFPHAKAG